MSDRQARVFEATKANLEKTAQPGRRVGAPSRPLCRSTFTPGIRLRVSSHLLRFVLLFVGIPVYIKFCFSLFSILLQEDKLIRSSFAALVAFAQF